MKYTTEQLQRLVPLLGRLHAAFSPVRRYADNFRINGPAAAANYPDRGVAWLSAGGGAAVWKAEERGRAELAELGLVRLVKLKATVSGAVLTPLGLAVAQDATDCPTLREAADILDHLWSLRDDPDGFELDGICWVSECKLAGTSYEKTNVSDAEKGKLVLLVDDMLPGLIAGLITARGDAYGRVWYGIPRSSPLPSLSIQPDHREPGWHVEPTELLVDLYLASRAAERNRLASVTPECPGDIGVIPISCSPPLRKYVNPIAGKPAEIEFQ